MSADAAVTRVGFLGPHGSHTERAARAYFGEAAGYVPLPPAELCRAVQRKELDYGVLAVENNTGGFVDTTLDAIAATADIQVCDEVYLPVHHQLLSTAATLSEITRIYSHPQAFRQCQRTLARLERQAGCRFQRREVDSTSLGAEIARSEPGSAAIASSAAAERYGLRIVANDIEDRRDNTTRFWVLSLHRPEPTGRDRTAFLVELCHRPGTLHALLSVFAARGINLLWIQARPIPSDGQGAAWEYAFFLEVDRHVRDEALGAAYALLRYGKAGILRRGRKPRVLGAYPNRLSRAAETAAG